MILVFDTETTGFPNPNLAPDHESQPYIVQLAAELCGDDGRTLAQFSVVIDNGVEIPEKAAAIHGITTERAAEIGIPADVALELFIHLYGMADLIVAHHAPFDAKIMDIALARRAARRGGSPIAILSMGKPVFCTMKAATPVVNIPPTERMRAAGFNRPKSPKLEECIEHFFGEKLSGAHDAMVDVGAAKRVYFYLKSLEQPAVAAGVVPA